MEATFGKMSSGPKLSSRIPYVKGTKPSSQNVQLLISTGVPSLDHIIGGGLPIGSIFLIEEDTYGNYAETLLKYFMAEGIVTSHALFVASQNAKPSKLVSEVPAVVTESSETKTNVLDSSKQMEIAWRYQNMKVVDSSPTGSNAFGHFYNLTKKMTEDEISKADMTFWDGENVRWNAEVFHNQAYIDLLKNIHATLKKENFSFTSEPKKRNVLRIALHSLGSRLWISDKEEDSQKDLTSFLYYLRAMLRDYFTVATITFPAHNFDNSSAFVQRMEHLSDYVIKLESFAGSKKETNPMFKDYHGLVHLMKLKSFNSLANHRPHSVDLAFKLRRKKFVIEILHLPPELGDSAQREQDNFAGGCGSQSKKDKLDF